MNRTNLPLKKTFVTAFAMFSMIFGGGNFILPPLLGVKAGEQWLAVALAFCISGVIIPILGIFVQSKIQGTMVEIGKKVHPIFGVVVGILMYLVCLAFPVPRTASVTYELSVLPYVSVSSLFFTTVYFSLVMYLCFNRSKVLDVLGKYLTPILLIIILLIIAKAAFFMQEAPAPSLLEHPFREGLLEGYQTFDAMAAVIVGGVIVTSLNIDKSLNFSKKQKIIFYAGCLSALGLFIIYAGFIYTGSLLREHFPTAQVPRSELLSDMSLYILGRFGKALLSASVSIACFTTAVGIITGAADFMLRLCKGSRGAYHATVLVSCVLGVMIGQVGTEQIVAFAVPVLVLVYPVVILLILLNMAPKRWATVLIFRVVIITAILFSLPDFLESLGFENGVGAYLPLSSYGLGWLCPSLLVWILTRFYQKMKFQGDLLKNG